MNDIYINNLNCFGKKITIERGGKREETYTLIDHVKFNYYFATKDSGRLPKKVYLIELKRENGSMKHE